MKFATILAFCVASVAVSAQTQPPAQVANILTERLGNVDQLQNRNFARQNSFAGVERVNNEQITRRNEALQTIYSRIQSYTASLAASDTQTRLRLLSDIRRDCERAAVLEKVLVRDGVQGARIDRRQRQLQSRENFLQTREERLENRVASLQ